MTAKREWSLAAVHEVVSTTVPDREMVVWRDVRRSYAAVRERSAAFAGALRDAGLGAHRERAELAPWECGQDRIALLLHNRPEHVEAILGCWKARAVPCNVNYEYTPREIAELLERLDARGVVYERALGARLAEVVDRSSVRARSRSSVRARSRSSVRARSRIDLLVEVDDGSDTPRLPGAVDYETLATGPHRVPHDTTPDDLHVACTGGTTGHPKAVLWRQADIFVSSMGGDDEIDEARLRARAEAGAGVWFPTSPMMHVAAQWTTFLAANMGATVVLHDDTQRFDAREILEVAERERANMMTIVGDAYGRPMIDELRRRPYDLSALAVLGTGGTPTSNAVKEALAQEIPGVIVRDGYGSSETGVMGSGQFDAAGPEQQRFEVAPDARILSADRSRFLEPGDDEVGWIVRRGHVPLGYLDDEAATTATFPVVDGVRLAVAGDRARYDADGRVVLLGRDSLVINTGGEKVFVEEVEDVLKRHDAVVDALVTSRPHDRFGQEVVAVVQLADGAGVTPPELRAWCTEHLARYKAPRAFVVVDVVQRHPSGKADYAWARSVAPGAEGA